MPGGVRWGLVIVIWKGLPAMVGTGGEVAKSRLKHGMVVACWQGFSMRGHGQTPASMTEFLTCV